MLRPKILVFLILIMILVIPGCSFSDKASTFKDDLINISKDQIATQLENSLNQQLPGVQVDVPNVTDRQGNINWDNLKDTQLGNYVFYSFGDYEFRAVLSGDGLFKIERVNHAKNETYSYAEFKVTWADGKFKVSAK